MQFAANLVPLEGPENCSKNNFFYPNQAARDQMTWLRNRGLA